MNPSDFIVVDPSTIPAKSRLLILGGEVAAVLPPTAPKRLTATQRLVRQPVYTRSQLLPFNFTPWLCAQPRAISEATTLPLIEVLAMLDADHPEGLRFVAVCKNSTRSRHVLTVLDLDAKRFYRATSATGMATFLKGLAKRRPAVKLLDPIESYGG